MLECSTPDSFHTGLPKKIQKLKNKTKTKPKQTNKKRAETKKKSQTNKMKDQAFIS